VNLGDDGDRLPGARRSATRSEPRTQCEVEHFTDPTCPWAFSAEPMRWRLRWLYGEQLAWTDRMVVLSEDPAEMQEKFPPPRHAAALAAIQERFGMPIDVSERPRAAASAPACQTVVAARLFAPEREEALLRALRVRIMGGELPDEPATLAGAAQDAGLDPAQLREWSAGGDAIAALAADRAAARDPLPAARLLDHKLGGPSDERRYTCPSYVATSDGSGPSVAPGFQPIEAYEVLIANVAPGLERRDEPGGVAEVLAWAGTPLATAEVALLCGLTPGEARATLADAGATERPVGRDGYWSL
jgi:predicted DsbA family dithiol-disulfide isomerase